MKYNKRQLTYHHFIIFIIIVNIFISLLLLSSCSNNNNNDNNNDNIKDNINDNNDAIKDNKIVGIELDTSQVKLDYTYEEIDLINFDGLRVYYIYENSEKEECLDYEFETILDYDLGKNKIVIKAKEFTSFFEINIKMILKMDLMPFLSCLDYTFVLQSLNDAAIKITSIQEGGTRSANTLVFYDESNLIKRNIYGYEIAVNQYGRVVDKDVNVDLPNNGFILSAHGSRIDELKQIDLNDYIVFFNDAYVFKNETVLASNDLCLRYYNFYEALKSANLKNSIFNKLAVSFNDLSCQLEETLVNKKLSDFNLIEETLNDLEEQLEKENEIVSLTHEHSYSAIDDFSIKKIDNIKSSDAFYSSTCSKLVYEDTLYYGGFRNKDTIVYYDNGEYYHTRNEFGYEIGVNEEGIVISKNTTVDIPENGYVLSGHSSGATFIKQIEIGDKIVILDKGFEVYHSDYVSSINKLIDTYNLVLTLAINDLDSLIPHDYVYINQLFQEVDKLIETFIQKDVQLYTIALFYKKANQIDAYLETIESELIETSITQDKAIWYYPFSIDGQDDSLESIQKTLLKLKNMGINEIIIDVFYKNKCLFTNSIFENYEFSDSYGEYGTDYLASFINEAHKQGIVVNAFTQTFMEHIESMKTSHPEYYQIDYNGEKSKGSVYYYDICNDELQNDLLTWYRELMTNYDFDKIEYDIIRYSFSNLYAYLNQEEIPESVTIQDPGYTDYAIAEFKTKYGYSGDLKELIRTSVQVRTDWLNYKRDKLNSFVQKCSNLLRSINPDVEITAAILSRYETANLAYLQDYLLWFENGYIDEAEPMCYTTDLDLFDSKISEYKNRDYFDDLRIGVSAKLDGSDLNIDLIELIRVSQLNGYVLFSSKQYLQDDFFVSLMSQNHHYEFISQLATEEEKNKVVMDDLKDAIVNFYKFIIDDDYQEVVDSLTSYNLLETINAINKLKNQNVRNYLLKKLGESNESIQ